MDLSKVSDSIDGKHAQEPRPEIRIDLSKVDQIIDRYDGDKAWMVMILQDVQEAYNFLPGPALKRVAERLGVSLSHVFRVATFYASFSLEERGRHLIRLCDGTACHMRGSTNIREEVTRQLKVEPGQTTEDMLFTVETVACVGACALAPVMAIDSKYYGKLTPDKVKSALDSFRKSRKAAAKGSEAGGPR